MNEKNNDGVTPFYYTSKTFIELLNIIHDNIKLVENCNSLNDFIQGFKKGGRFISNPNIPSTIKERLIELTTALDIEQREAVEAEEKKGGCPFINMKKREEVNSDAAAKCPFLKAKTDTVAEAEAIEEAESKCPFLAAKKR